ncbi:hypothetical protein ACQ4WX_49415 [Streptomyces lasalocidi]
MIDELRWQCPHGNAYIPHWTAERARIGAVFEKGDQGAHFCTASVAQSPSWHILIAVAICTFDADSGQPDRAFLVLDHKHGKDIQDLLSGNALGMNRGIDNKVKITGHPASRDTSISDQNHTTKFSDTQLRIQRTGPENGRGLNPTHPHPTHTEGPSPRSALVRGRPCIQL